MSLLAAISCPTRGLHRLRVAVILMAAAGLLVACGGADDEGAPPAAQVPPFPTERATAFAHLSLAAYQQLDDFLANRTFVLPEGYTLQEQLFVPQPISGDLPNGHDLLPIGYVATRGTEIHVTFRGTRSADEWLADVNYPQVIVGWLDRGGRVYQGFDGIYRAIRQPLLATVNTLLGAGTYRSIHVTGHSLGGALAVMAAAELAQRTGLPVEMYSFGAPRVGDPEFVARYRELVGVSWRIANVHDPVPGLPPREVVNLEDGRPVTRTYMHVPVLHVLRFGSDLDVAGSHDLCGYHRTLCAGSADPGACRARARGLAGCSG